MFLRSGRTTVSSNMSVSPATVSPSLPEAPKPPVLQTLTLPIEVQATAFNLSPQSMPETSWIRNPLPIIYPFARETVNYSSAVLGVRPFQNGDASTFESLHEMASSHKVGANTPFCWGRD
jgi:hypothetical protein